QVFLYLPLCFAAMWIVMLTSLSRNAMLLLSTDLTRVADEIKAAEADYFVNVPTLLERVRAKVEAQIAQRGGIAAQILARAKYAYSRMLEGHKSVNDWMWLA